MATPDEDLAALQAFWHATSSSEEILNAISSGDVGTIEGVKDVGYQAAQAMTELAETSKTNTTVRQAFAAQSVFEQALGGSVANPWQSLLFGPAGWPDVSGKESPALIMLNTIRQAATGGFFSTQDPSGIVTWIHSPMSSAIIIAASLAGESNYLVLEALLDVLYQAAIPLAWAEGLLAKGGALDSLDARVGTTQWVCGSASQLARVQGDRRPGASKVRGKLSTAIATAREGNAE